MDDYAKLLERAHKQLPEKAVSGERFEPPMVETYLQGTRTIVKNFEVICQKIRREPPFLSKFFSKELAVPTTIDGTRLVLHGKFYDRVLNDKLTDFINTFVLCKECKKPDTRIISDERGVKMLVCEACGARSPVKG